MAKVEIIWNLCLVPAYLCVTFVFRTEMNNNMARNLLNKYIWLIETIYKQSKSLLMKLMKSGSTMK